MRRRPRLSGVPTPEQFHRFKFKWANQAIKSSDTETISQTEGAGSIRSHEGTSAFGSLAPQSIEKDKSKRVLKMAQGKTTTGRRTRLRSVRATTAKKPKARTEEAMKSILEKRTN